jgi:hypothetical protein
MPFTNTNPDYASLANTGYEATVSIGSPLVEMLEITGWEVDPMSVPEVPKSHLKSPNNTEEFAPGMIKTGSVNIEGNFIGDATQLQILTMAEAQSIFPFQLKAAMQEGAKTYLGTGNGYFSTYKVGKVENNKVIPFSASIKLTGAYAQVVS